MTHAQWNSTAGIRQRAMTSPNRDRKFRGHVLHRTVIPIIDDRPYDVMRKNSARAGSTDVASQSERRKQVTYLPLQHVHSSLPSLFRSEKTLEIPSLSSSSSSRFDCPDIRQRSGSNPNRRRYSGYGSREPETTNISRLLHATTLSEDRHREYDGERSGTRLDQPKAVVCYKSGSHVSRQNVGQLANRRPPASGQLLPDQRDATGGRDKSPPAAINPILKRRVDRDHSARPAANQVKGHRRRACFKQEVDVRYFDTKDRPRTTIAMPRQSQDLSCGAYIVNLDQVKDDFRIGHPAAAAAEVDLPTPVIPPNQPVPCLSGELDPERGIACSSEVTFIPCVDGKGKKGRLLRLNIRANGKCVRERTLVKALTGGGAVVIHLFQNEAKDGGSAVLRRHVKKLALPVNIDPYRVRAHVHKDGLLTIEAPVMDCVLPNI